LPGRTHTTSRRFSRHSEDVRQGAESREQRRTFSNEQNSVVLFEGTDLLGFALVLLLLSHLRLSQSLQTSDRYRSNEAISISIPKPVKEGKGGRKVANLLLLLRLEHATLVLLLTLESPLESLLGSFGHR
jgi:hypothetical protein